MKESHTLDCLKIYHEKPEDRKRRIEAAKARMKTSYRERWKELQRAHWARKKDIFNARRRKRKKEKRLKEMRESE
jgi:hypothetical protein